jgi:hypothetical protein
MKDISQMASELRQLPEQQFRQADEYGDLVNTGSPGSYVLITKWLTTAEAREKYGEVTELRLGPRGGYKGVTYGKTSFLSRRMDPRK